MTGMRHMVALLVGVRSENLILDRLVVVAKILPYNNIYKLHMCFCDFKYCFIFFNEQV